MLAFIWALILLLPSTTTTEHTTLPNLALQHILSTASPIFGMSPSPSPILDLSNWMSHLPSHTPLTSLSIPGAHDAATWSYTGPQAPSINTQHHSISTALQSGIRFFDLRYALDVTGTTLVFYHHSALLSQTATVADVLFAFYAWLDGHAGETVLLSLQYEGGTLPGAGDDAVVQGLLYDVLMSEAGRRYILQTRDEVGTLGEARGRVVLVRRFDLDRLPPEYESRLPGIHLAPGMWTDNSPGFGLVYNAGKGLAAWIEDYYEPDVPPNSNVSVVVEKKMEAVTAHLEKAIAAGEERMDELFITFTSGRRLDDEPPVFPETMALGEGKVTPEGGVNAQLERWLQETRQGKGEKLRLGVVVLDYLDEPGSLVGAILGL